MQKINLLDDKIYRNLARLSFPIMITSFIQMSYTLMDTFWVAKLGTDAVAGVGIVAFIMWFVTSFMFIASTGIEVGVAYSIGSKDDVKFRKYIDTSFVISLVISFTFVVLIYVFRHFIIDFFKIGSTSVFNNADSYVKVAVLVIPFHFINPLFAGIFTGSANSKVSFIANTVGLVLNIILDPIFIYGYFGVSRFGVKGAAIATVISQFVVFIVFLVFAKRDGKILKNFSLVKNFNYGVFKDILRLGLPVSLKSALFAFISTILLRIVAIWGESAVAAENVAVQIEAINWMTVGGFSSALCALISQNYGAKNYENIKMAYKKGIKVIVGIGIFSTFFLYFSSDYLIRLFIKDDLRTIEIGVNYLKILAFSEIFFSMEIGVSGMFNGLKNSKIPTVISTLANALRIPLALLVVKYNMSIEWIWVVISFCTFLKGFFIFVFFKKFLKEKFETEFKVEENLSANTV